MISIIVLYIVQCHTLRHIGVACDYLYKHQMVCRLALQ